MSKNNTIRKSDKKFIRLEKARIRRQFLDASKQEELINELYRRFLPKKKEVVEKVVIEAKPEKVTSEKTSKKPAKKAAKVK